MSKVRATIVVEEKLWKEFKKKAIDKDKRISEFLEDIIKKEIKGG